MWGHRLGCGPFAGGRLGGGMQSGTDLWYRLWVVSLDMLNIVRERSSLLNRCPHRNMLGHRFGCWPSAPGRLVGCGKQAIKKNP